MTTTKRKPMTYADLAEWIAKMTPEQRAMDAVWVGEERGGRVYAVNELDDDQIAPDCDGMMALSVFKKECANQGMSEAEIEEAIEDEGGIIARKGQPRMDVDE